MRLVPLLIALGLFPCAPAFAAHWHLKADGSGDFATIAAGIAAAASGDTLLCADGTYTGSGASGLDFAGKNLVLRSESDHPKDCIIRPSSDRAFYFHSGETAAAIVQGFTISYGGETQGGGIYVTASAPTFFNCVITHCQASDGAGAYLEGSGADASFLNCVFALNQAINRGGAVFFHNSYGTIENCTIVYNEADDANGAALYVQSSTPAIHHNILWGNWNYQITGVLYDCSNNLIQGWVGGSANFDGDPAFTAGTGGAYYLTAATSDAVDAGTANASATCYPSADGSVCLSGWTTRTDQQDDTGLADLGYHYPHMGATISVPSYKPTIQAAIDAAWHGDVVSIADGTYTGDGNRDLVLRGKRITVRSASGNASSCTIDCQGSAGSAHRGFYVHEGEGAATVIQHLRVINGWTANNGGGIYVLNASPTIHGCILNANHAEDSGGGMMCLGGASMVDGCTFTSNSAGNAGGGMLAQSATPTLNGCLFQSNTSLWGGAGLHDYQASPTLTNCTFRWNNCGNWGGGMHHDGTSSVSTLIGCVFDENQARDGGGLYLRNGARVTLVDCDFLTNSSTTGGRGGGIYSTGSRVSATRCVFAGNDTDVDGGGLYGRSGSRATLDSCLFARNTATSGGGGIYFYDRDTSEVRNCTFYQNETANGGGLWTWSSCSTIVTRCIFWDNRWTASGPSIGINTGCSMSVGCSDVQYGQGGVYVGGGSTLTWLAGNFAADPWFCSTALDSFTVDTASPCAPAHSGGCGLIGARPVGCARVGAEPVVAWTDRLRGASPNPFATRASIAFETATAGAVSLRVYDVAGRLVRVLVDGTLPAGSHEVPWNGRDDAGRAVAHGAYFVRLTHAGMDHTLRLVLVR